MAIHRNNKLSSICQGWRERELWAKPLASDVIKTQIPHKPQRRRDIGLQMIRNDLYSSLITCWWANQNNLNKSFKTVHRQYKERKTHMRDPFNDILLNQISRRVHKQKSECISYSNIQLSLWPTSKPLVCSANVLFSGLNFQSELRVFHHGRLIYRQV